MTRPFLFTLVACAAFAARAADARAAEVTESVRLAYEAAPECPTEAAFLASVAAFGGTVRTDDPRPSLRSFAVTMRTSSDGGAAGSFAIGAGTRTAAGATCAEVARSLALFVALALVPSPPPAPAPRPVPAEAEPAKPEPPDPPDRAAVAVLASTSSFDQPSMFGGEAWLAAAGSGAPRFGGALAVVRELAWSGPDTNGVRGDGYAARLGGWIAAGAPWNDGVFGFLAQLGIAYGQSRGAAYVRARTTQDGWCTGAYASSNGDCWSPLGTLATSRYVSPYLSTSLILQAPLPLPVRPFAAATLRFVPSHPTEMVMFASLEVGVAWRGW